MKSLLECLNEAEEFALPKPEEARKFFSKFVAAVKHYVYKQIGRGQDAEKRINRIVDHFENELRKIFDEQKGVSQGVKYVLIHQKRLNESELIIENELDENEIENYDNQ